MRTEIRRRLNKHFADRMKQRLPAFHAAKSSGKARWELRLAPELLFYVELIALRHEDSFVIDVGWTDGGVLDLRSNRVARVDPKLKRFECRLGRLWCSDPAEPAWDIAIRQTEEEQRARTRAIANGAKIPYAPPDPPVHEVVNRIPALVDDAIDRLSQHAIPLFRRVAEERGQKWPNDASV